MLRAVPGTMAAIIGLENEQVEALCKSCHGLVIPANYNCDGQVVISGEKDSVAEACDRAKAEGAKRALPLAVSGASTRLSWSRRESNSERQ